MRRHLKKIVFFVLALAIGGGLFAVLLLKTGFQETVDALAAFGILPCIGFILISLLNFTFYSLRWQIIINDMLPPEKHLPLHRVFMHRMSGFAAGYLTPASQVAGEPIRVAMLHTDHVPVKEATSSVIIDLAFEISAVVLFIISGLIIAVAEGIGGQALYAGAGFIVVLVLLLIAFFWSTASGNGFFSGFFRMTRLSRVKRLENTYHWIVDTEKLMKKFFSGKPGVIALIVVLSLVMVSFKAIEAYYIASFYGVAPSLRDVFLLATLPGIALLLPVPAGLGVFEGSNAAIFSLLGLPLNPVAFTAIIRIRDFVFIALGVMHAVRRGEHLFGKKASG